MSSGFAPLSALVHLFFPHNCCGCGSDLLAADGFFCISCFSQLPFTQFENIPANPVEKLFSGRVDVSAATALFYFTEGSAVQQSLHRFKYGGVKTIGIHFGTWMAERIRTSQRFLDCDEVIALPLHAARQRKRGYNQAAVLAAELAKGLELPMHPGNLIRTRAAGSQTLKNRVGRWKQIQDSFRLKEPERLAGKHLLLVDDVVTTGSTLEAAARLLLSVPGVKLSLAALACSVQV